ncbi:branched chain amino acid ABC transporter substrate-binding protein [Bacillus sp. MUM 116]|uniref:branched-chain amino acid ABC transporter substrate-binding protein n=1 Tax=Bacillus sp. MUM 116 TaxID=1678002 RepID=UPI0008F5C4E8|nr:branched-chain amino acid ABC transporter substrate-binding protein [Bacillus sp. MUM 116]OIK10539.1 branched chain amino acid ABC transporter substrate-binding protein [Bacillus sp. MUM 116]
MSKWLSRLGLLVIVMLMITACSSKTGGSDSSSGKDKGGEILIGTLTPITGSSAKMGEDMNNAIQMAADEINTAGGINGKKIKLVKEDEGCDPQIATAGANKLVSKDVVAVVGGYCSGAVLPASGVMNQANLPWILTAANSAKIPEQGFKDIFLLNSTAPAQAKSAAEYMVNKLGAKKIAIINDNSAYAVDLAERTRDEVKGMGANVVAFDAVNPEEKDFNSLMTKLKELKPDATYWTGYYNVGGLLAKQFHQAGVSGAFGVGDGSNDPTIIKIAGKENAEGLFVTTTPTPQFQESAKDWIPKYKEKFGADPGPYSAISYDGMRVMADAIKRAGSTDKDKIIKALSETNGYDTFSGPLKFKENGETATSNFVVLIVKNGQMTLAQ